jgi:RND family efflux transporter MFP subunit
LNTFVLPSLLRTVVIIGCLLSPLGLVGCQRDQSAPRSTKQTRVLELSQRDVVTAKIQTLQSSAAISGTLQALESTTLQAQVAATIQHINIREGDIVKRGDVLMTLHNSDLQARLAQAQANLASVHAQLSIAQSLRDRNAKLFKKGFVSEIEYERSVADANAQQENAHAQQAMVNIAQKGITDSIIRAPMSGLVARRLVEPSQAVNIGQTLLEIVDPSVLELKASAPATTQQQLTVGQSLEFRVQGSTQQRFTGTISRINPVANSQSRTIHLYARVENTHQQLRAGLFAEGIIQLGQARKGVVLPLQAIQRQADQSTMVWVIRQGLLQPQIIQTIDTDAVSGLALVTGIQAGEQVTLIRLAEGAKGRQVKIAS